MSKITYVPQSDEDPSFVTWAGLRLEANKSADIPEGWTVSLDTAKANPWFKVSGAAKAEPEPDDEDEEPEHLAALTDDELRARAKDLGLDLHSRTGRKKLVAAIVEAEKA